MDFVDLQTFRAVVDHGGVTAAARHLHRVQSSVSARLAALEQRLGSALFERTGKHLRLTPEGRHLYERSAALVRDMDRLRAELAPGAGAGLLRLGAMESTAAARLPLPLVQLRQSCPRLQLVLRTGTSATLLDGLARGDFDAVLVAGPQHPPSTLHWQAVFEEELVQVAPLHAGGQHALVTFSAGCAYRAVAQAWGAAQAQRWGAVVEIGSYHALLASVAAGMGVGLLPRSVLALCDTSAVVVHDLPPVYARQTTWLVSHSDGCSPALAAMRACLGLIPPEGVAEKL